MRGWDLFPHRYDDRATIRGKNTILFSQVPIGHTFIRFPKMQGCIEFSKAWASHSGKPHPSKEWGFRKSSNSPQDSSLGWLAGWNIWGSASERKSNWYILELLANHLAELALLYVGYKWVKCAVRISLSSWLPLPLHEQNSAFLTNQVIFSLIGFWEFVLPVSHRCVIGNTSQGQRYI